MRTAVVIGAGIGGLAAARALVRRGWRVQVLERARALESVGAGLAVAPNALRALDVLGLGDAVRARGAIGAAGIRTWRGRWLLPTDADAMRERFGDTIVVLPRAELMDLLGGGPVAGLVHTSTEAVLTDPGGPDRPARVTADGREWTADLVVAADGVRSRTRESLWLQRPPKNPGPVYSGTTAWRLLAPRVTVEEASESWGPEGLVGVMPLAAGGTYFYAMARVPAGTPSRPGDHHEHAELVRRFGHWHDPIPDVLADADPGAVLRNDVWHSRPVTRRRPSRALRARTGFHPQQTPPAQHSRPVARHRPPRALRARTGFHPQRTPPAQHSPDAPPAYHRGRVAVLGDAAHAMTPNLGQGACMALEDAVTLAHAVGEGSADTDLPEALAAYTAARLPRADAVVRRSAAVGRMSTLRNPVARVLRDAGVGLVGRVAPSLFYGPVEATFDWCPPTG
ncbi:2-polyprenyl-6-methoxyphenol hydroxylase-like FAD-dependent oxidoreductase [Nocardiopsis sp. Huas11]|uniref:FAD-dependent monooxygenase n=1 Tax=Nocardiopsis sp. Huas11 TaxID=2183912 RepID=UPI000EAB8AA4|nr:FAD-dependent monooxygenase [Nocardiopsis sp. Huas11]RKS06731.1 2-polyprenyl-6-methoxyphenol hydroxylase-like FAD-dependent oxidoreductase [Nocardiopsis sp. Huas11]